MENIKITITKKDIDDILYNYDKNNANQIRTAGSMEYSLFEMVSKRFMNKIHEPELQKAINDGIIYAHDQAQELFKGINCFVMDPRFILRKGVSTYGDNHYGVTTKPANRFNTALEHIAQTMGLSSTVTAGGQAVASFNVFLAPYIIGLSDDDIYQAIQQFMFQMNESYKNRGCVSGDTEIWTRIDNEISLMTFYELSELINADYGESKIPFKLEVLTIDDDRNVVWHEASSFWRNEERELYEIELTQGKTFVCDDKHSLIRYNKLDDVNILDIKNGTQLCKPEGINFDMKITHNKDYWDGVLYGFYLGDGYKKGQIHRTCISVGKIDKKEFLDEIFNNVNIPFNYTCINKKTDERHKISEYHNYYFDRKYLVKPKLDNPEYLAGLISGCFSSNGNVRLNSNGFCKRKFLDISFQNSDKEMINILKYALFFFGIKVNCKIKSRKNPKPNWSPVYRINLPCKTATVNLFKQLYLRPSQRDVVFNFDMVVQETPKTSRTLGKVTKLEEKSETFCLSVNGKMIITSDFILTNNSQSMFSSICLDLKVPDFLKEKRAIGPGGVYLDVTYGELEEEAKKIAHTITKVSFNGDGVGKPLFFPNLIYNIDNINLNEWVDVFDLCAKYALPYFSIPSNNNVEYASVLGCRSNMPSNWTGDPEIDCMGTGNSVYTTICLPCLALKCEEEGLDFFEQLDYYMELVRKYNKKRLNWIKKLWYDIGVADFMIQELDGKPLYRLEDATIVCGYLGLSECLEILYGKPLHECNDKAVEIMKFMRERTDKFKIEDNLRWSLFQTPAENCTYKLASKMVKKYGFKKSCAKGTATAPYYTNSNHVPVDADINIIQRIKIEGNNQPIGPAGNIMNIYTSEAYSDPYGLMRLVEKIREKTNAYFFAITGEYSICNCCNATFKGLKEICPVCSGECDQFSRITGYVSNVKSWNSGKRSEFVERKRY